MFQGDGLIYGGDPVLLGTKEGSTKKVEEKKTVVKKITKYSFLDDKDKVK